MSHRIEQAESLLRKAVTQVLQREVSDPRIRGLVSVTYVDISPDMRQAKIGVTVMPAAYEKRTIAGLTAASGHIHGKVKKRVALRTVPHLKFEIDHAIKRQAEVFAAIDEGMRRTGDQAADPDAPAQTPPPGPTHPAP